jgi:hypothetical protein
VAQYKKMFQQLQQCSIRSSGGRSITLDGQYKDPPREGDSFIEFKTSIDAEPYFISIKFEKEDDRYFVWLKVFLHNKY